MAIKPHRGAKRFISWTVTDMRRRARLRGFTLVEMIVVVVILSILATLITSLYFSTFTKVQDTPQRDALRALAADEETYFGTYGSFAITASALAQLEPNYSYVIGTAVSTGPGVVSVSQGTIGTATVAGVAILGPSGQCNIIIVFDPTQSSTNITDRFTPTSTAPCSGAYAVTDTSPSNPWT